MKLNVKAFAVTVALFWSFSLFLGTWWLIAFNGSSSEMTFFGELYRGYTVSPMGSLIGFAWALPDGLIGGAIFAWMYNFLLTKFE